MSLIGCGGSGGGRGACDASLRRRPEPLEDGADRDLCTHIMQ